MLKLSTEKLPKQLTGAKANLSLLAQVVHVLRERGHVGLRQAKTRSEVNRTTKKVYKQKGTGGARHGSRRANVFRGGGVVFGPRAVRRILTLPKALKAKAKEYAFNVVSKETSLVDGVKTVKKTQEVAKFLKDLKVKRTTFVLSEKNLGTVKYMRNLKNVNVYTYKDINAFQILEGGKILVDSDVFAKETKTK